MATLKFVNEAGEDEILHFGSDRPEILVGRNKGCDLKTKNNTVSRLHAKFCWASGRYTVVDLDSANGTYYHKVRIHEAELEDGESVFVGSLPVEFKLEQEDFEYLGSTEMDPPTLPPSARRPSGIPAADQVLGTDVNGTGGPVEQKRLSTAEYGPGRLVEQPAAPQQDPQQWGYTEAYESAVSAPAPAPAPAPVLVPASLDDDEASVPESALPAKGGQGSVASRPEPVAQPAAKPSPSADAPTKVVVEAFSSNDQQQARPQPAQQDSGQDRRQDRAADAKQDRAADANQERARDGKPERASNLPVSDVESARKIAKLESEVAEKELRVKKFGAQIDDLSRLVARYQSESASQDSSRSRIADLEHSLAASELSRGSLEDRLESANRDVARAVHDVEAAEIRCSELDESLVTLQQERDEALSRLSDLEAQLAQRDGQVEDLQRDLVPANRLDAVQLELEEAKTALARVTGERDALGSRISESKEAIARAGAERDALNARIGELKEEVVRFGVERDTMAKSAAGLESLKKGFEAERTLLKAEVSDLRRQMLGLNAQAQVQASAPSEDALAEAKVIAEELADLKNVNRSYMKKISRLMEENEAFKTAAAAQAAAQAAVPVVALPPLGDVAGSQVSPELKESVEKINDTISEFRTGLHVLGGLVPEMMEKMPEGEDDETREQITTTLAELVRLVKEIKAEALKARKRL